METWRAEATQLFTAGRSAIERADRVLPVVGTVVVAGSVASVANDFPEGLLVVPTLLALSLAYVMNSLSDALTMGFARRRIERALADELGTEVMVYETHVAPLRRAKDNPSVLAYPLVAAGFLVAATVVGLLVALGVGAVATVGYCIGTSASCLLLGLSVRDERRLWRRAETHYAQLELRWHRGHGH